MKPPQTENVVTKTHLLQRADKVSKSTPHRWGAWEVRVKSRHHWHSKQPAWMWLLLHLPSACEVSLQAHGLPGFLPQGKTGELLVHRASASALPRKLETLEYRCKNQD